MNKKKVLVSGKMPKAPTTESKEPFLAISKMLGKDVTALFPTVFAEPTATWEQSIKSDISALMICEELHLLHNWQGHKRSEILRNIALMVKIKVVYH